VSVMDRALVASATGAALKSCCANLYELPITQVLLGTSFHPGGPALTRSLASAAVVGRATRVLDVASGTGTSARVLAEHFGCEVVGVDLSARNVATASRLAEEAGLGHRVRFAVGDAEALPFDDSSFDVVLCECALCTFPDMATALDEMKRVLVPMGRVGLSDIVLERPPPAALHNVVGHVLCITGALSRDGYRDALRDAGFSGVRHRDVSRVLSDMVDGIESRLDKARRLAAAGQLEVPEGFEEDAGPTLAAARDFVRSGGGGYALFTARKR
jgi:arsenite methyltransferase